MIKILVTTDFCNGCKKLIAANCKEDINSLRTVLILLSNQRNVPKKYRDHRLVNSPYRELHISGDVLLLYRYEADSNTLTVSLKLSDITNHKRLSSKAHEDNHDYFEVSTEDLHNITSSSDLDLDDIDAEFLNDFLESLSDYASIDTTNGYVLLSDYYIENNQLHCIFELYSDESNTLLDSIDFVIDLSKYNVEYMSDLSSYLYEFANEIAYAFNN